MSKPTGPIARTVLAAQSDERLVKLIREGHEQAFDEVVRRYRSPLVGFATAIVNHDRAEDVVQTALEKANRALLADDREINLRPWLFTIVRNGALNLIRSEPVTDELDPLLIAMPGSDPEHVAERNEEMDRLFTAICALPSAQREALVRRELEGVGHGEIASQLGTTATAVRGLIFRARTQVRNAVGALVPLPMLRALLAQGAGVAGGAGGAALFGGAGAKGAAAVAAAVVALGAGIAVEKRHGDRDGDVAVAEAAEGGPSGTHGSGKAGSASSRAAAAAPAPRDGGGSQRREQGGDSAGGSDSGSGAGDGDGGESSGSTAAGTSGSGHSGSGHSGSDSGSDDSGSTPEPPEHEDSSGSGDDSSGPSGHESSGSDEVDLPDPPEVETPEQESSGPGDGVEEPDDGGSSDDGTTEGSH